MFFSTNIFRYKFHIDMCVFEVEALNAMFFVFRKILLTKMAHLRVYQIIRDPWSLPKPKDHMVP